MRSFASLLICAVFLAAPAEAQTQRLTYRIQHQLWGDIGTIAQDIRRDGEAAKVATEIDIRVRLLGLTLYKVDGRWNEVWHDGKLRQFEAKTVVNGTVEIAEGRASDRAFVIRSGEKRIEAPADVQPVNPWSLQFVRATTLMSPETGRLHPARVRDADTVSREISGTAARLHHYVVCAGGEHHLYFDADGTLVQFEFADITGKAVITLVPPDRVRTAGAS